MKERAKFIENLPCHKGSLYLNIIEWVPQLPSFSLRDQGIDYCDDLFQAALIELLMEI